MKKEAISIIEILRELVRDGVIEAFAKVDDKTYTIFFK